MAMLALRKADDAKHGEPTVGNLLEHVARVWILVQTADVVPGPAVLPTMVVVATLMTTDVAGARIELGVMVTAGILDDGAQNSPHPAFTADLFVQHCRERNF